jgi:hypothetical protein
MDDGSGDDAAALDEEIGTSAYGGRARSMRRNGGLHRAN